MWSLVAELTRDIPVFSTVVISTSHQMRLEKF